MYSLESAVRDWNNEWIKEKQKRQKEKQNHQNYTNTHNYHHHFNNQFNNSLTNSNNMNNMNMGINNSIIHSNNSSNNNKIPSDNLNIDSSLSSSYFTKISSNLNSSSSNINNFSKTFNPTSLNDKNVLDEMLNNHHELSIKNKEIHSLYEKLNKENQSNSFGLPLQIFNEIQDLRNSNKQKSERLEKLENHIVTLLNFIKQNHNTQNISDQSNNNNNNNIPQTKTKNISEIELEPETEISILKSTIKQQKHQISLLTKYENSFDEIKKLKIMLEEKNNLLSNNVNELKLTQNKLDEYYNLNEKYLNIINEKDKKIYEINHENEELFNQLQNTQNQLQEYSHNIQNKDNEIYYLNNLLLNNNNKNSSRNNNNKKSINCLNSPNSYFPLNISNEIEFHLNYLFDELNNLNYLVKSIDENPPFQPPLKALISNNFKQFYKQFSSKNNPNYQNNNNQNNNNNNLDMNEDDIKLDNENVEFRVSKWMKMFCKINEDINNIRESLGQHVTKTATNEACITQ